MLSSNNIIPFLSSDKDTGLRFLADSSLLAFFAKYVYILLHIRGTAAFIVHAGGNVLCLA